MQGQIEYQYVPNFERTGALVDLSRYGAGLVKDEFVPWCWAWVWKRILETLVHWGWTIGMIFSRRTGVQF